MTRSGRAGFAAPRKAHRPAQRATIAGRLRRTRPSKALRPWIEVALPHPDVLANRFKEAEFAADLFAVDSGHAAGDYATPREFLRHHLSDRGAEARSAHGLAAACRARAAIR